MPTPRSGACAPWLGGPEVEALLKVKEVGKALVTEGTITQAQLEAICAEAAVAASDVLYELSGRIFPGACGPVTVRPVNRPTDSDSRAYGATLSSIGWVASQGFATAYGSYNPAIFTHFGSAEPPSIELPYAVTEIKEVKIDGVVIPAEEYELQDFKTLVRVMPPVGTQPTQRYGWPSSQLMNRKDTEPGTFSITYMYGNPPPALGMLAAKKLSEVFALPQLGGEGYPRRITSMQRQGVSAQITDVMDLLQKGMLGIYEVDAFIAAYNPKKLARQSAVWSPDISRTRRQEKVG